MTDLMARLLSEIEGVITLSCMKVHASPNIIPGRAVGSEKPQLFDSASSSSLSCRYAFVEALHIHAHQYCSPMSDKNLRSTSSKISESSSYRRCICAPQASNTFFQFGPNTSATRVPRVLHASRTSYIDLKRCSLLVLSLMTGNFVQSHRSYHVVHGMIRQKRDPKYLSQFM